MSEVAVSKKMSEVQPASRSWDLSLPVGRLFNASPFTMMREFANEMDRVFRGNGPATGSHIWAPSMDVQQSNGNLVVSAELPGLKKEDVKVDVTDDTLTIQGERRHEHKEDHEGYHLSERNYGRFYRAIPLPEGAKTDQVKAELKDGVLKVSIPAAEATKRSRQVPVIG